MVKERYKYKYGDGTLQQQWRNMGLSEDMIGVWSKKMDKAEDDFRFSIVESIYKDCGLDEDNKVYNKD